MRDRYGVIIADPAWRYSRAAVEGAAEREYRTMSADEICALPVRDLAADNAVLLLWGTWPPRSGASWTSSRSTGSAFWVRGCSEFVFVGRRGSVSPPVEGFVGLLSENFGHSRKPESLHHYAETLPGPYLELFARRAREGWDAWGNEVAGSIDIEGAA